MPDLVEARWLPGYPVQLPSGQEIGPGDTVRIPASEAADSDHWEVIPTKTRRSAAASGDGEDA